MIEFMTDQAIDSRIGRKLVKTTHVVRYIAFTLISRLEMTDDLRCRGVSFWQSTVDIILLALSAKKKRRVHTPFRVPSTVDNPDDCISISSPDSRRTKPVVRFLSRNRETSRFEKRREREKKRHISEHKAKTFATRGCPCALIFRSTRIA